MLSCQSADVTPPKRKGGTWNIGRGRLDANMCCPQPRQSVTDHAVGKVWPIAIAAEMPQVHMTKVRGNDLCRNLRRGIVRQMTVPAQDPLLRTPRAPGVLLKHLNVMIGLQDQHIRRANPFDNELGGVAKIRKEPNVPRQGPEKKAYRIIGVVWHTESLHQHITQFDGRPRGEQSEVKAALELQLDRFLGQAVAVDGYLKLPSQHPQSLSVIGMFVGNQDSAQVFRCTSDPQQSLPDLSPAKTRVDQQTRILGFQVGTVAA